MTFSAVTTFSDAGHAAYGWRMVETHRSAAWHLVAPLTAYHGNADLEAASDWLTAFKARHAGRPTHDYRRDAARFAHKVAAILAADAATEADVLIWVDGDTVFHRPIGYSELVALAPNEDQWIAWPDRVGMYPECGFLMFNRRHPRHGEMMAELRRMYADDALFGLDEWHDSWVMQEIVKTAGVGTKSLSGAGRSTMHPVVKGPLGWWIDHLKGPSRKRIGQSRERVA